LNHAGHYQPLITYFSTTTFFEQAVQPHQWLINTLQFHCALTRLGLVWEDTWRLDYVAARVGLDEGFVAPGLAGWGDQPYTQGG
jgi:hypothetical protein